MSNSYRPFGDDYFATRDDFRQSDSYAIVRVGLWLLIAGYVLLPLVFVAIVVIQVMQQVPADDGVGVALHLIWIPIGAIGTGFLLLLNSPHENERGHIQKFWLLTVGGLIARFGGLMVGVGFGGRAVASLLSAYAMLSLIQYFVTLAENRSNAALAASASRLNWCYIAMFGCLVLAFVAGGVAMPKPILFSVVGLTLLVCYLVWLHTLWLALRATLPVAADKIGAQYSPHPQ